MYVLRSSYTAEGEYDSFPTVEFDRLVVEHAEPRAERDTHRDRDRDRDRESESQAKQHADWARLFGEPSGSAAEASGFQLTRGARKHLFPPRPFPDTNLISPCPHAHRGIPLRAVRLVAVSNRETDRDESRPDGRASARASGRACDSK
jgi:hypothetical protein